MSTSNYTKFLILVLLSVFSFCAGNLHADKDCQELAQAAINAANTGIERMQKNIDATNGKISTRNEEITRLSNRIKALREEPRDTLAERQRLRNEKRGLEAQIKALEHDRDEVFLPQQNEFKATRESAQKRLLACKDPGDENKQAASAPCGGGCSGGGGAGISGLLGLGLLGGGAAVLIATLNGNEDDSDRENQSKPTPADTSLGLLSPLPENEPVVINSQGGLNPNEIVDLAIIGELIRQQDGRLTPRRAGRIPKITSGRPVSFSSSPIRQLNSQIMGRMSYGERPR